MAIEEKRIYRLGETYIDKATPHKPEDEFMRWLNQPGSGMRNSPGIRPFKYITSRIKEELPAFIVLVSFEKTNDLNPWIDEIDLAHGRIGYWGDAKDDTVKSHKNQKKKKIRFRAIEFEGNKMLTDVYQYICSGKRELAPPILHFKKLISGTVIFQGLCILESMDVRWHYHKDKPVQNYKWNLSVLEEAEVSVEWLQSRAKATNVKGLDKLAPNSWLNYLIGKKDVLNIFRNQVKSRTEQVPPDKSPQANIIKELLAINPYKFEALIVDLFEKYDIVHSIAGTKPTGDGGFDFFGKIEFPLPLNYNVSFKGECKRYNAYMLAPFEKCDGGRSKSVTPPAFHTPLGYMVVG